MNGKGRGRKRRDFGGTILPLTKRTPTNNKLSPNLRVLSLTYGAVVL